MPGHNLHFQEQFPAVITAIIATDKSQVLLFLSCAFLQTRDSHALSSTIKEVDNNGMRILKIKFQQNIVKKRNIVGK